MSIDINFLVKENAKVPRYLRVAGGISVLSMWLGYIFGGGKLLSPLSLCFFLHALSSIVYEVWPGIVTLGIDTHFIDLVTMERLGTILNSNWVYLGFVLFQIFNSSHRLFVTGKILVIVGLIYLLVNVSLVYILSWAVSLFLFMLGDYFLNIGQYCVKGLVHILFHMSLGVTTYLESSYYPVINRPFTASFGIAYMSYVLFSLVKFGFQRKKDDDSKT